MLVPSDARKIARHRLNIAKELYLNPIGSIIQPQVNLSSRGVHARYIGYRRSCQKIRGSRLGSQFDETYGYSAWDAVGNPMREMISGYLVESGESMVSLEKAPDLRAP